jgi:hypothetical protein
MAGAAVGDILVLPATAAPSGPFITQAEVLKSVQAAQDLKAVPSDLRPSLSNTTDQAEPGFGGNYQCGSARPNKPDVPSYAFGGCTYGDLEGKKLMVAYGDSHAGMWGEALQYIALREGWRLVTFYLPGCPAPDLRFISWTTNSPNTQCNLFHESAPAAIDKLHPQVVVVTSEAGPQQVKRNVMATGAQWEAGWSVVIRSLQQKGTRVVMIGDIPQWDNDDADCLSAHMGDVQACAAPPSVALAPNVSADESAARETNISYISPAPWICAKECEPVVDGMRVYLDQYHLTATYVAYLSGALQGELPLGNG